MRTEVFELLKIIALVALYAALFVAVHELTHAYYNNFQMNNFCFLNCPKGIYTDGYGTPIAAVTLIPPIQKDALNEYLASQTAIITICIIIFLVVIIDTYKDRKYWFYKKPICKRITYLELEKSLKELE